MSDLPDKPQGVEPYLPPPPDTRGHPAESLHFPRMDPPPASLEALMRNRPRPPFSSARSAAWLWLLALVAGVALAAYVLGLHR